MKKSAIIGLALVALASCFVSCKKQNDDPVVNDENEIRVTGTYLDTTSTKRIFLYENKEINYLAMVGNTSQVFQYNDDLYMMVVTSAITELYKNNNLIATVPFQGLDFVVVDGHVQVVGAGTLAGGFPTTTSERNAVWFNTAAEQVMFYDASEYSTSEANYIYHSNGTYYTAGKVFLTSPSPKLMAWVGETSEDLYGPSTTTNIVYANGSFVCVGTKVYTAGKSVAVQMVDSVATILTDTSTVTSSNAFMTKIQDVYSNGTDVLVAATETINGTPQLVVWMNGNKVMTFPSTSFGKVHYKYGKIYLVTKGLTSSDPYTVRCDNEVVGTLPLNVVSVDGIEIK